MEKQGFGEFQLFRQAFIQIVFWLGGRELLAQETEQVPDSRDHTLHTGICLETALLEEISQVERTRKCQPLTSAALRQSPYSPRAKQRFSGCSTSPHPTLSLRTRLQSQNPRLPLAAGPAMSSSLWEVPGPGMAMVMKVDGGVKALAGWGGAASERGLPATLPRTRLSLRMEELPASWGRLASATLSSGFAG